MNDNAKNHLNLLSHARNKIFLILILALTIRLLIAWQPVSTLMEKISVDDCFLGYAIANNIATGKGITYNGIDQTNGFQPLFIFLISPIYLFIKNKILAINFIYTFLAIIDVINVFLIFKLTRQYFDDKIGSLAALMWTTIPMIFFQTMDGLEVSLFITMVLASLIWYNKIKDNLTLKNSAILGLLLGLSYLARGDGILLFIIIGLHMIYYNRKIFFKELFVYIIVTLLVISPWLIWNYLTFGTISQSSYIGKYYINHGYYRSVGPVKTFQEIIVSIEENVVRAVGALAHQLGIIDYDINAVSLFLAAMIGISFLFSLKYLKRLSIPIVFCIVSFLFYTVYLWAVQIRYMTPEMPFLIMLIAAGISNIYRKTFIFKFITIGLVALMFLLIISNGFVQWDRSYSEWQANTYNGVLWAEKNIPRDAIVGSFSPGIIIYFSNHTVIELDGLLNYEATKANLNKSMYSYMKSRNITYWFDITNHCFENCPSNGYFESPFVAKDEATLKRWQNDEFDILQDNLWTPVFESSAKFSLIYQDCKKFKSIRGFGLIDCIYVAEVL